MRRPRLRRLGVMAFIQELAARHPELHQPVTFADFHAIAVREGVHVQVLPLSRPARLLRLGQHVTIQLNRALDMTARARFGMHELCHFWRDDIGEPCYHAEDEWVGSEQEDFAEMFAWIVTAQAPRPVD